MESVSELAPRKEPSLERARSFDRVAELYAAARPGYPEALFERLFEQLTPGASESSRRAAIPRDHQTPRALEIGTGPALATLPFARRGFRLTCLEPGAELVKLARERLREFRGVTIVQTTFEDWPLEAGAFDLVFAAQAFHWIAPAVSMPKAADALKSGGALALFWNRPADQDAPHRAAFNEAYRRFAPDLERGKPGEPLERWIAGWKDAIDRSARFGPVTIERFPWSIEYDRAAYLRLMGTFSDHLALPAQARDNLHAAIGDEIERLGGRITMPRVAVLFFARRAPRDAPSRTS